MIQNINMDEYTQMFLMNHPKRKVFVIRYYVDENGIISRNDIISKIPIYNCKIFEQGVKI